MFSFLWGYFSKTDQAVQSCNSTPVDRYLYCNDILTQVTQTDFLLQPDETINKMTPFSGSALLKDHASREEASF